MDLELLEGHLITDAEMNEIKAEFHPSNTANVNMKPYHIYSTDERVVGKWIDGSTLYEKTIPVTIPGKGTSGTTSSTTTQHNISNFGKLVDLILRWYDTADNAWYTQFINYTTYGVANYATYVNSSAVILISMNQSSGIDWTSRTENATVTIQYTKTTI